MMNDFTSEDRSERIKLSKSPWLKVGVVSDTHVPDRVNALHPELLAALMAESVDVIFHLGDISVPSVIKALQAVAPVYSIRGNRDLFFRRSIPTMLRLEINGVSTTLLHGQGSVLDYILDKLSYVWSGYQFERYEKVVMKLAPEADVVVFGHTHRPEARREQNRLLFNPGAVTNPDKGNLRPTFGVLWYYSTSCVESKIIPLKGAHLKYRRWIREDKKTSPCV